MKLLRHGTVFSLVAISTAAVVVAVSLLISTRSALGAQTTPPPYSHSWYVTNVNGNDWYTWAHNVDGPLDNSHCTNSLVILDFGQPDYQGGTYGTIYFAPNYPFVSDLVIIYDLENYSNGWYQGTGNCPRLHLVAGTNNYHEIPSGGGTPSGAGSAWADSVRAVQNYLVSNGTSWQITADDMEQPGGGQAWDCANPGPPKSPTRSFIDGYNGNSNRTILLDYGTAWVPNPANGSCWSAADVAYVAYTGLDYPLPEIYFASALNSWISVRKSYYMYFKGVLTTCKDGDPLPSDYCSNPSGWYAPTLAWNAFWYNLALNGVSQSSLDYAPNIK